MYQERVIHLCRIRHDKPLRKITIPEYSSHDIWMVDRNNTLWGAGYNHYGVLNTV